ncbi:MAG: TIGR02281 family clan AA aspartic protease [Immundisolibacter sp.]|uniref:retropepsin-like aspartic protease family protein n=1 Tax=Immundisolibacter sp. TaxID=1934948 RepID=UPI003D0A705B
MHRAGTLSCAALALLAGAAAAEPLIELQAILGASAVLQVDGVRRTLRVGQASPEGVRLVALDGASAKVEIEGRTQSVPLGGRAGGAIQSAETATVRIAQSDGGMYVTTGSINGKPVEFLVDTGATTVAMNDATARRLGIDYRVGERRLVETASGITESWFVTLREVSVGAIRIPNVQAGVIRGDQPSRALLGMSFLSRTRIEHEHDTLVLKRKY